VRAGKVADVNMDFQNEITESKTKIILKKWGFIVTGERPPSSMIPVILESKSGGLLVIGGSGGSMITSAVALVIELFAHLFVCFLLCLLPLFSFYSCSL